ncbi:MAG TPA: hypothetical protein VIR57_00110 [Chloroflexota bacterium]
MSASGWATLDCLDKLYDMQHEGSSVTLNWGEDNGLWECSWITGGKRFTGFSSDPEDALDYAHQQAIAHFEAAT